MPIQVASYKSDIRMSGSAQGLLPFLSEDAVPFKVHGLRELLKVVATEWPQIAEEVSEIEELAKDLTFPEYKMAASLASKTMYYVGRNDMAVQYALLSGDHFDPFATDTYSRQIVSNGIQHYIGEVNVGRQPTEGLMTMVEAVLNRLLEDGATAQCLCLAIETRFMDLVKQAMEKAPELVTNAIRIANTVVSDAEYRASLLRQFVEFAKEKCDKVVLSQLHHSLRDPESTAQLLKLLKESEEADNWLIAYQIAFELAENASQKFRSRIIAVLPEEMVDMREILMRKKLLEFYHDFLMTNVDKDTIQIIDGMRSGMNTISKLIHTSIKVSWAYMFAGTGVDGFFREEQKWFFGAGVGDDWSDFMTVAAVGTVHNGRLSAARNLLSSYINKDKSMHVLGGALYALGLICANYLWDQSIVETLTQGIANTRSSVVKHGGCLGLGLVALGSHDHAHFTPLLEILNQEDPIAGEAAAYASGLVMLGCGASAELEELRHITENTKHEKITRGGAMALGFMMYGKEGQCETLVEHFSKTRVPLLRESAAWILAMAYIGTASNTALKRLLHMAISDVNQDVRRAAIIGIGFVLSKNPKEVPAMIDLLGKSYNPAVRNGAALALGIACAGTGMKEAVDILKPLLMDVDEFVRQSANIGMAMVLQQQSDVQVPYCKEFRMHLRCLINRGTNEVKTWGVCLAYGILNASSRNVVISCNTLGGENSILSTVGLAMFCNYLYWHPLSLMLTLAFHPTAIIGVDANLQVPEWVFLSYSEPSVFAAPPSFDSEKVVVSLREARKLSIQKAALKREEPVAPADAPAGAPAAPAADGPHEEDETPEKEIEFEEMHNSSRVTVAQLSVINVEIDFHHTPITNVVHHGIVLLKKNPDEE